MANIKGIAKAVKNKIFSNEEIEALAMERIEVCKKCPLFEKERIALFAITDTKIKEASKMMCSDCGCSIPLKIRQNLHTCNKWSK